MPALAIDRIPQGWNEVGDSYDQNVSPFTGQYAQTALELAGLPLGARVLDVAAGTGALALRAARAGMEVLAADFAPGMLARLDARVRDEGLQRVRTAVMDGQALELEDASFDAVFSIFGLIFFPDRLKGFREMHRVLAPGGRAFVTAWSSPDKFRIFGLVGQAVRKAFPQMPPPAEPPAALSLADREKLRAEMAEAGFRRIDVLTFVHPEAAPSAEVMVDQFWTAAPPLRALLGDLDEAGRAAFRRSFIEIAQAEFGDGPVCLDCEAHIGIGTK